MAKKISLNDIKDFENTYYDEKSIEKFKLNTNGSFCTINRNVLHDSEMIDSFSNSETVSSLFKKNLHFTQSIEYLNEILSNPLYNVNELQNRQKYLLNINQERLNDDLKYVKEKESSIRWMLTKKEKEVNDMFDTLYYSWWIFNKGNTSSCALTLKNMYSILISPTIGILSPILYFIIPFIIMRLKFKINISCILKQHIMLQL
jgi:hypothetical protein